MGNIDDISLLGAARDTGPLFQDVREVFKVACGVDLKLKKCSLLILQMHTVLDPEPSLISLYNKFLNLAVSLWARRDRQGTVIVDVPIGTP